MKRLQEAVSTESWKNWEFWWRKQLGLGDTCRKAVAIALDELPHRQRDPSRDALRNVGSWPHDTYLHIAAQLLQERLADGALDEADQVKAQAAWQYVEPQWRRMIETRRKR